MTTTLLIMLVLIELARLSLQYNQGKTYKERIEKTCCIASEVENAYAFSRTAVYKGNLTVGVN